MDGWGAWMKFNPSVDRLLQEALYTCPRAGSQIPAIKQGPGWTLIHHSQGLAQASSWALSYQH